MSTKYLGKNRSGNAIPIFKNGPSNIRNIQETRGNQMKHPTCCKWLEEIHPHSSCISVARVEMKNNIGFVWLALTLESKQGYEFFESLSPRPMRCKFHVAGGVSIRCCLHHRRKAIPKRLIKKFPRESVFKPGGMVRSIPCIAASDATPLCHKPCKIGSST